MIKSGDSKVKAEGLEGREWFRNKMTSSDDPHSAGPMLSSTEDLRGGHLVSERTAEESVSTGRATFRSLGP